MPIILTDEKTTHLPDRIQSGVAMSRITVSRSGSSDAHGPAGCDADGVADQRKPSRVSCERVGEAPSSAMPAAADQRPRTPPASAEHRALRHERPNDIAPPLPPCRLARRLRVYVIRRAQQQVDDVRTSNQQDEADARRKARQRTRAEGSEAPLRVEPSGTINRVSGSGNANRGGITPTISIARPSA